MDGHYVNFYENEESYADVLTGYIGSGLEAGGACIVLATQMHRARLEEGLKARGLCIASESTHPGRYVALDAAEALSEITVQGWPDADRTAELIQRLIKRTVSVNKARVRIFGELVSLLFSDGKPEAAIHLEALWNRLAVIQSFDLLCAYPANLFCRQPYRDVLSRVCAAHTGICLPKEYGSEADK